VHAGRPRASPLNVSRSFVNGREPFSSRYTAPDNSPGTAPGTEQCPVRLLLARRARQRAPVHRTEGHRTELPVRSFVRCIQLSAKSLGLATGQKRHVTRHVRCLSSTSVRCFAPLCLARPRATLHRTGATGQNPSVRCSVRCFLRALFSAPFFTLAYTHQHQSVPSPCARVLVFSQAFSQGC
jgi:hypothetical protein